MSTTPATTSPYSGTSIPATTPAARPPGMAEGFTDAQLQAAIDAAFLTRGYEDYGNLATNQGTHWQRETLHRLAIARRLVEILAAMPQADPYALLKAYNKAGARIRIDAGPWETKDQYPWKFDAPPHDYEVHPDDLHLCPEYAPKPAAPWVLPAETSAEPEKAEEKPCGLNSALDEWSADDGPPWIPHDGGPCPLKDEEVEEWEWKLRDGQIVGGPFDPSKRIWSHAYENASDIIAYRVLRWKPGHGPQAAQYYMPKLPNPLAQPEPDTFEAHGKTWTRHTPGDPCPVDTVTLIDVLMDGDIVCVDQYVEFASTWDNVIGWRYADEPAQAPAAPTAAAERGLSISQPSKMAGKPLRFAAMIEDIKLATRWCFANGVRPRPATPDAKLRGA